MLFNIQIFKLKNSLSNKNVKCIQIKGVSYNSIFYANIYTDIREKIVENIFCSNKDEFQVLCMEVCWSLHCRQVNFRAIGFCNIFENTFLYFSWKLNLKIYFL